MKMSKEEIVRIDVRLKKQEKAKLLKIGREKGCEGITAFLRLLTRAKKINIEL